MSGFALSAGPVDLAQLREALQHPGSGGFCSFEGWVRNNNDGRDVSGLEYEAYADLALAEGTLVIEEAIARYGVLAAQCVHRTGDLKIGELAVWIGVSSAHRDEAFRACRYIIDEIKHRLPIWKKEHYLSGDTAWVACSHTERAHEHEALPVHGHAHHTRGHGDHEHVALNAVTPANAGAERLESASTSLDSSVRWNDERNRPDAGFIPDYSRNAVTPANAGAQRLESASTSLDSSVRWNDERNRQGVGFIPDYSRQTRLREVGEAGQAKLAASRVLVIGAGGLGCPVLAYLAGAGVGTLGIVDGDTLDASNLHRQTMYDARDVGQLKVELAKQRIAALNPSVEVHTYAQPLDAGNVADVFAHYDLVVECTDDMRSRYLSSDAAVLTGTPLILASVYQYEGQLQVVTGKPGDPCLRCLWPQEPAPGVAGSCVESGVLGPVPGVLGAMQAAEALKILLDIPRPADHALVLVNLLDMSSQHLPIDVAQGCAQHGGCIAVARHALAEAQDEDSAELRFERLDDAIAAGFTLIDVRESSEIAAMPIEQPSRHLPSGQVGDHADEFAQGRVLLICASGKRSDHAARLLRGLGLRNVHSLSGGLAALRPVRDSVPG
jgi:adenylyltransferase/sulfurtransferase